MNAGATSGELFGTTTGLPDGLVYEPEFIDRDEEERLLAGIAHLPLAGAQYHEYTARRRIASFGASYDFARNRLEREAPIPPLLLPLRSRVAVWVDVPEERFGHALVTEYAPGTPLGWHRDVPQFGIVVGVSLGTACRMRFRSYPPRANRREGVFVLELAPRSVYVLQRAARWQWQHSIAPTPGLRYSITFCTGGASREAVTRE